MPQVVSSDRFRDVPPPVLIAICEVCGEAIRLEGSSWVHDKTGIPLSGQHLSWPRKGTQHEAEVAQPAPGGSAAAFW